MNPQSLPSLLFHSGYLTILDKIETSGLPLYKLGFPNFEVRHSFLTHLIAEFSDAAVDTVEAEATQLKQFLKAGNMKSFMIIIRRYFKNISYHFHIPKEAYYQSLFYTFLFLMGLKMDLEKELVDGRIDGVLETETHVFILEFKYGSKGTIKQLLNDGIMQIHGKKYADAYQGLGKQVVLVAVAFLDKSVDTENRVLEIEYRKEEV